MKKLETLKPTKKLSKVINTEEELKIAAKELRSVKGAIAVDTERAANYRYGRRAFLVQISNGSGKTWLIDSNVLSNLQIINKAIKKNEWILHAAIHDLPCLHELNLVPTKIFDTEVASRLAGLQKVSLRAVAKTLLNINLDKQYSTIDWSIRPLEQEWLNYAVLDVEVLPYLRTGLINILESNNKLQFALEEFKFTQNSYKKKSAIDLWRKTEGIYKIKQEKQLAIVKNLWLVREEYAKRKDIPAKKVLHDCAIIVAAENVPSSVKKLLDLENFSGIFAKKEAILWQQTINKTLKETDSFPKFLPAKSFFPNLSDQERVLIANKIKETKFVVKEISQIHNIPPENILPMNIIKKLAWEKQNVSKKNVEKQLHKLGVRNWQIKLVAETIHKIFINSSEQKKKPEPKLISL